MNDLYSKFRNAEAIAPIPRHILKFEGADHERYLNGQLTNNVASLREDSTLFAAVTNGKGKMDGEVWLHKVGDSIWVDMPIVLKESLPQRFEKFIIADDVIVSDVTPEHLLFHSLGTALPQGITPDHALPSRRLGEDGWDIWLPTDTSPSSLEVIDESTLETVRIENGFPSWGKEMTSDTLPPELGLEEMMISYTKGCYIGQEVISRIKSIGHVNRCLVSLNSEDQKIPTVPEKLLLDDKEAGTITSAIYSPKYKKVVALGIIHRQYLSLNQSFQTHDGQHWKLFR